MDLDALLSGWSDRHRYPELSVALFDGAGPEPVVRALLRDLGGGRDPQRTVEHLVERGCLSAARRVLDECDLGAGAGEMDRLVEQAELRSIDEARSRIERLRTRSVRLGLPSQIDPIEQAVDERRDPIRIAAMLDNEEARLDELRDAVGSELREAVRARAINLHEDQAYQWALELEAAIDQEHLLEVRAILDGKPEPRPPWFVMTPSIDDLPTDDAEALDIIQGIPTETDVSPMLRRRFARGELAAVVGPFREFDGSIDSAQRCADVLVDLVRGTHRRVAEHRSGDGFSMPFHELSSAGPAVRIGLGAVTVWIARPGVAEVPPDLEGLVLAIGDALDPPEGRHQYTVIGWRDLVRVAMAEQQPDLVLLRLAAAAWPVEAVLGESNAGLEQRMATDRGAFVDWLLHLLHLGGMIQSGAVLQATGGRPALVRRVLLHLADPHSAGTSSTEKSLLTGAVQVEDIFDGLAGVGPSDYAAFWALLAYGQFDEPVEVDDLIMQAQFAVPDATEKVDQEIDIRVRDAVERLVDYGVIQWHEVGGSVRLHRWDYVDFLRPKAEARLAAAVERVVDSAERTVETMENRFLPLLERLRRHRENANADSRVSGSVDRGPFDVEAALAELKSEYEGRDRSLLIDIVGDDFPAVAIPYELFWLVIDELLRNAAECNSWRCRITISVDRVGAHLELLVEDDGVGVEGEMRRRLFRPGASGRGSTGDGLHYVRMGVEEAGGRIEYVGTDAGGAGFLLKLPVAEG